MDIQPLTIEHLEFRLVEEPGCQRNWFVPHMCDLIRYQPDGCFALCDGDNAIGMVTTTAYQGVGWIGWLYVAERCREQGLGARLMQAAISYLKNAGMRTILLEGVVEAEPLYRRLGFRRQFITQHFRLKRVDMSRDTIDDSDLRVGPFDKAALDDIVALDHAFFHQDRRRMFEIVIENENFGGCSVSSSGRLMGFLWWTRSEHNRQVGPCIVDSRDSRRNCLLSALLETAFDMDGKPLYLRCPMVDSDRAALLVQCGAERVDYHTIRMYLGEPYRAESPGVLSLGCPGKG